MSFYSTQVIARVGGWEKQTTVGQVLQRARKDIHHFLIYQAGDAHRVEGAVCGDYAVELAVFTFLDELSTVGCGWFD